MLDHRGLDIGSFLRKPDEPEKRGIRPAVDAQQIKSANKALEAIFFGIRPVKECRQAQRERLLVHGRVEGAVESGFFTLCQQFRHRFNVARPITDILIALFSDEFGDFRFAQQLDAALVCTNAGVSFIF